jgi:hypothetical protein
MIAWQIHSLQVLVSFICATQTESFIDIYPKGCGGRERERVEKIGWDREGKNVSSLLPDFVHVQYVTGCWLSEKDKESFSWS